MRCSGCTAVLTESARFCPSCGLPRPTAIGFTEQRKLVSVLFCDLVGSTELAGVLEPEMLRSVVLRYFDMARHRIEAHGGTVEKFIGDAVMAVFGFPTVHEDDARRAAAAALDVTAGLAELNADLVDSVACRLAVRIGVNTGEVVTSAGEGAQENLVSGEVVNVAARLEQHAAAGEILIGPTTRRLLGEAADAEEVGALALKGKREPVTAYRLRGIRQDTGGPAHRSDSPFVGRERELALLNERWDAARNGLGGQRVTVSGDAGIGKTRLLREWLSALPHEGALTGLGRCHPYRDQASLTPLAHAMRQILDAAAHCGLLTERLRASPPFRVLRSGLLLDGAPGRSADSTYSAVAAVLSSLSVARPVALVLDDLQWADSALLDAVAHLARTLRTEPVMLVCSGRPEQTSHPSGTVQGHTSRKLEIGALSSEDCTRLAAELVELQAHGSSVLTSVIDRAEGNPLFLEQLLAMLDDGVDPEKLPVTVTAVLTARIDALGSAERLLLDAAAVVGRQFDARAVEALVGTATTAGPHGTVQELVRRGFVEPSAGMDTGYRFRIGLLREVTYRAISKRRRADWHEVLAGEPGSATASRGHHLEQAYLHRHELGLRDEHTGMLRERAARALTEAGLFALARADLSWSEDLLGRAMAHSTRDDPWWTTAARGLGETWLAIGRTTQGGELLREVMTTAASADDQLAYAHARLQLAALDSRPRGLGSRGGKPRWFPAAEAARDALPVFESAGDRLGLARGYIRLAQEQQFLGSHGAAEELLASALRHAVAAGAAGEHAMALGAMGISLWHGPTPAAEAVRRCRELLSTHGGDHDVVVVTLNYPLANLLALQGFDDDAQDCLATANRFAGGLGYAESAVFAPLFAAGVEALAGRLRQAEGLLLEALKRCKTVGDPGLVATASRDLARVLLRRGEKPGRELLGPAEPGGLPPAEAADHAGVHALAEAARGNVPSALRLAHRAVAEAVSTDSPITLATAQLDFATVCLAAGHLSAAATAADRAASWFGAKGHLVGRRAATALLSGPAAEVAP